MEEKHSISCNTCGTDDFIPLESTIKAYRLLYSGSRVDFLSSKSDPLLNSGQTGANMWPFVDLVSS